MCFVVVVVVFVCCFYYMECDTHCSLLMKGRLPDRSCAEVFLLMFCYFDILVPIIINIVLFWNVCFSVCVRACVRACVCSFVPVYILYIYNSSKNTHVHQPYEALRSSIVTDWKAKPPLNGDFLPKTQSTQAGIPLEQIIVPSFISLSICTNISHIARAQIPWRGDLGDFRSVF